MCRSLPLATGIRLELRVRAAQRLESRSAALHKAVRLLRASELGSAYEDASTEWTQVEDDQFWGAVVDDGLA